MKRYLGLVIIFLFFVVIFFGCVELFLMPGEIQIRKFVEKVRILIDFPKEGDMFNTNVIRVRGNVESSEEIDSIWMKVDDGRFEVVGQNKVWDRELVLDEGIHKVYVYATSKAGSISSTNSVRFGIDITKPSLAIQNPETNSFVGSIVIVRGVASDNLSGIREVRLRVGTNGGFGKVSGTTEWSTNLTGLNGGENEVYVYVVDNAGNVSDTNSVKFVVDIVKPGVVISLPSNNQVVGSSVLVSGSASDNLSGVKEVWLRLGNSGGFGRVNGTESWSTNLEGLSEGTYEVYVYAVDNAGNISDTNSVRFVVSYGVVVSINTPTNNQLFKVNNVLISGSASSILGIKEVWLRLGSSGEFGRVSGTESWSTNLVGLSEGTNEVYVYAVDNGDSYSSTNSVKFVVDITGPSVIIAMPTNNQVVGSSVLVSGSASDNLSGVKEVWLRLGSSGGFGRVSGTESWSTNLVGLSEGINEVYVYAIDNAGNVSDTNSVSFVFGTKVYVSVTGNDGNVGVLKTQPVRSIQKGLILAYTYDIRDIYVSSGIYSPGSGLNSDNSGVVITNNSIRLVGGFDSGFNSVVGYSELDAGNSLYHVVFVDSVSNVVISNFIVKRGNANGSNAPSNRGGGIYLSNVSYSLISNVVISNNYGFYGGGIYLVSSYSNYVNAWIVGNNSGSGYGGGVYLLSSSNNVMNLVVSNNIANNGGGVYLAMSSRNYLSGVFIENFGNISGGGLYLSSSHQNIFDSVVIIKNKSVNHGGGVYMSGSLSNTISGNILMNESTNQHGGGIYLNESHHNTFVVSVVSNKSEQGGGGVWIERSTNNVIEGSIIENIAKTSGGGVFVLNSTNNTIKSVIISNTASQYGGGVALQGAYGNVISSNVISNVALTGGGVYLQNSHSNVISGNIIWNTINGDQGGGIYLTGSYSNVISGNIVSNNAINGGGIYLANSSNNLISGIIEWNRATYSGGGIYLNSSRRNNIEGSIRNNNATDGGGIYLLSSHSNFIDSVVEDNSALYGGGVYLSSSIGNSINGNIRKNTALWGGGIYLTNSHTNIVIGSIESNKGSNGGGIYLQLSHSNVLNGSVVDNSAYMYGGGIYIHMSYGNVVDANVKGNSVTNASGGGICLDASTNNLIKGIIASNQIAIYSAEGEGGGILLKSSSVSNYIQAEVIDNVGKKGGGIGLIYSYYNFLSGSVSGNTASDGGGIYLRWSSWNQIDGSIVSNSATSGGGVYLTTSHSNMISGSIVSNSATSGGGVYLGSSRNNMISGSIVSNSGAYGGGIYLWDSYDNAISNSSIVWNSANYGGGMYLSDSRDNMISSIIVSNMAQQNGGGVYLVSSHTNTISGSVVGNIANNGGGGIYLLSGNNNRFLNLTITNNWGVNTNSVIHLFSDNVTGLVISNCLIGGNNDTDAVGIWEEEDIMGHTLKRNVFITSMLKYLYREANYLNSVRWISNDTLDRVNINLPIIIDSTVDSTDNAFQ